MIRSNKLYAAAKTFVILSGCTLGLFLAIGLSAIVQSNFSTSPVTSMKGITATVSSDVFKNMLALEMPHLEQEETSITFSAQNLMSVLFQSVTGVDPHDPKTLLAMEVPGLGNERAVLFRGGQAGDKSHVSPMDMTPPQSMLRPHVPQDAGHGSGGGSGAPTSEVEHGDLQGDFGTSNGEASGGVSGQPRPDRLSPEATGPNGQAGSEAEELPKTVFIYHSHNRESWLPELEGKTAFSDAFHPEINVTLLGKRMAEKLEQFGIGATSSDVDYPTTIPGYNWNFSYKYSLDTVREASAVHGELEYFFDIHRDAQARDLTTATIDGVDYAQLFFIVGHRNPEWEKNEAFASELHERIESRYPGVSRGIWGKSANTGHAEYNQSISPNSILVEVGGPENTLEESYRTIDLLAEIFAEYYWETRGVERQ